MSYPYFYNEYLPSNRFPNDLLVTMKTNNDYHLANKAMYKELHKIELLVLGQNNLYGSGSANPVTYTYTYIKTSISGNDYFGTLMQKLSAMFRGCFIYYTRDSSSQTLTTTSIMYDPELKQSSYVESTESITNVLFISQTEKYLPLHIPSSILYGKLVFSYNYIGICNINSLALANIPLIFVTGVFDIVGNPTATISGTLVTVTVNTRFDSSVETSSVFGLTFYYILDLFSYINNLTTNIIITILNNIPLSKKGSQFNTLSSLSIVSGQKPIILPNTFLNSCFNQITNFNSDISGWDISNVISTRKMFSYTSFNQNIGVWNTINVTNMSNMFYYATLFNNGDISGGTNNKMLWTFNNLVDTNSWHLGSALTKANAPTSLPW